MGIRERKILGTHHPEPNVPSAYRRSGMAPIGGTEVPSLVVPCPATFHTVIAGKRPLRVRLCPLVIVLIPVPAPFPHISVHIVQSPGIGRKTPHIGCHLPVLSGEIVIIGVMTIVIGVTGTDIVP